MLLLLLLLWVMGIYKGVRVDIRAGRVGRNAEIYFVKDCKGKMEDRMKKRETE